jgi:uncharacterized membrane protein YeaQ/YmgE (transglycosylase-associated protein family)
MNISNDGLIVIILVGIVAGWLAGQLMHGGGFGLIGDLIVGILGSATGCSPSWACISASGWSRRLSAPP